MSSITVGSTKLSNQLQQMMDADDLLPGDQPSYQMCKALYTLHPLGAKMADAPIKMAQSQQRTITVPASPEDMVVKAFCKEWKRLKADKAIASAHGQARVYGITSLALIVEGEDASKPIDYSTLYQKNISFNVFDPLNTAGSLVLSQDTNSINFQKPTDVTVNGQRYHRSRTVVVMNENPIYLDFTSSAFGFVGRSVYQRALYPLKSFLQTMVTDDMVSRKVGVMVAMLKPAGSIVDRLMTKFTDAKRSMLRDAKTDNVLSIGVDEKIESLNLRNLDSAGTFARTNVLKNIATSADMPAVLLENETLTEGFGEGTEDAKTIARYVDNVREDMEPTYTFMDRVVMYRAWTPEFYKLVQKQFPDYATKSYTQAFYEWVNSFDACWPSLLIEPESEQIKVEETKYKAIVEMLKVLVPILDPENKAALIEWATTNFNENKMLFPNPLEFNIDALQNYAEETLEQQREALDAAGDDKPTKRADSVRVGRRELKAILGRG